MLKKILKKITRPYNFQIYKRGNYGISIPKMLRESVGHDSTHLSKSSWKCSVIKQKKIRL